DDLDAPDLDDGPRPSAEPPRSDPRNQSKQAGVAERSRRGREKPSLASAKPVLTAEQSAILRERLLEELVAIGSTDQAAVWAQRNLPAKNALTAVDAKIVEEWFQTRLSTISDGQVPDGTTPVGTPDGLAPDQPPDPLPDKNLMSADPAEADTSQKASTATKKRSRSGMIRALGKRSVFAIRTTGSSYCGNLVLCVAACRRIRITSRLPNRVRLDTE